ncbi:antibiotic biosynthesis monooxygenase [Streptomyces sp. NPDC006645]|uniref:putative quinol monooxygenase n=1 Tax=unclassified Streptomyces TaxID=2593676 RepID=UPI0033B4003D
MHAKQPGLVMRLKARPGKRDELFTLCHEMHFNGDPDGPVDWALSRSDEDPDIMWAFEFYRDDESMNRHYTNPELDAGHQRVMDLLAEGVEEWGVRVPVHIVTSS